MAQANSELRQLKGIGRVLAQRLKVAGLENCDGIVEAGEEGLKKIPGIRPTAIPSILDQAKALSDRKKATKAERIEAIKGRIVTLKEAVNRLAENCQDRVGIKPEGKCGKKLTGAVTTLIEMLNRMEEGAIGRVKRAERGVEKAEKRMAGLEEAGLKKIRKGLKKSKKALTKGIS